MKPTRPNHSMPREDHGEAVLSAHAEMGAALVEVDELAKALEAAKERLASADARLRQLARAGVSP